MEHLEQCAALDVEIARFAEVLGRSDPRHRVPTCPDWSVHDLAAHLGLVHRWAEHLVRRRAQSRIPSGETGLDDGPVDPGWILEGGARLVGTLRSADPDAAMWAWGADQHVRFWPRRQLHETLLHRIDLELAAGDVPHVDASIAVDGIDELLVNLAPAAAFSPGIAALTGDGDELTFAAVDTGRTWTVVLDPGGFSLTEDGGEPDAALEAGALELLLVLYRRTRLDEAAFTSTGDLDLIRFWLDHSALG